MKHQEQLQDMLKERQKKNKRLSKSQFSYKQCQVIKSPKSLEEVKTDSPRSEDEEAGLGNMSLKLSQRPCEMERKAKKYHGRATKVVTSGALTFILLAATMVTTSFILSPVIEQIFGKIDYIINP